MSGTRGGEYDLIAACPTPDNTPLWVGITISSTGAFDRPAEMLDTLNRSIILDKPARLSAALEAPFPATCCIDPESPSFAWPPEPRPVCAAQNYVLHYRVLARDKTCQSTPQRSRIPPEPLKA
jgi:hypothetical protein